MNFYLNAITVTEKDGEVKVLQEPKITFATSQKDVEYMALKTIPKKYAKKLGNIHIYVQQLFNYNNYSGYGSISTYPWSTYTNGLNGTTTGSIITADTIVTKS